MWFIFKLSVFLIKNNVYNQQVSDQKIKKPFSQWYLHYENFRPLWSNRHVNNIHFTYRVKDGLLFKQKAGQGNMVIKDNSLFAFAKSTFCTKEMQQTSMWGRSLECKWLTSFECWGNIFLTGGLSMGLQMKGREKPLLVQGEKGCCCSFAKIRWVHALIWRVNKVTRF